MQSPIIIILYIIYIYIFHPRYLHNDIFTSLSRYPSWCYLSLMVLSHGCTVQAHYQSSYSNLAWSQVFWVFTATFTPVETTPPSPVRAAAIISAGVGCGESLVSCYNISWGWLWGAPSKFPLT